MNIKKVFIGGIAGGVIFFLLGWLIYGMLLTGFMNSNPGASGNIMRPQPEFLYLAIGNLSLGFMIAYVFDKAGISTVGNGFVSGGILGLLIAVGYDCMIYATTTTISKKAMAADVLVTMVMAAIAGAVIAAISGMGKNNA